MIRINVHEALAREAQRKAEVKPLPNVKVVSSKQAAPTQKPKSQQQSPQQNQLTVFADKEHLLGDLNEQMKVIKTRRGKLSTRTWFLVNEVAEKLRKESPGMAIAFLDGELPMPELAQHYSQIQACTEEAIAIWDNIRYVEQYGKLPDEVKPELPQAEGPDIDAIHYNIRRLDDLIYKCNDKIRKATGGLKQPKNSERITTWRQKISLAEAQRDDLKHKLKSLQYDARGKRTGEE